MYDPLSSSWECYIYAVNPEDEDEVLCIINCFDVTTDKCSLKELSSMFNSQGEGLQIDHEYRPRNAQVLYKILQENKKRWTV